MGALKRCPSLKGLLLGGVTSAVVACGEDKHCLLYDYAPPSAIVKIRDTATGELLCDENLKSDRGSVAPHPDDCEYWIAVWFPDPSKDAGPAVTLKLKGYIDTPVEFDVRRNECGEIQRPAKQTVDLQPEPEEEPEPGPEEDAGTADAGDGGLLEGGSLEGGSGDGGVDADRLSGSGDAGVEDAADAADGEIGDGAEARNGGFEDVSAEVGVADGSRDSGS